MEFGRVSERELDHIDFSLPQDPSSNKDILSGVKDSIPKVYLGCSKWGRSEWVGKIYPPKTDEKDFLEHYGKNYNSIELNATHYRIHSTRSIGKWAEKTSGKDFLYCPKMYKGVTHERSLYGKKDITEDFLAGVSAFEEQLGPIFVQVSESFSPKRIKELFDYLKSLPTKYQFFVEVRNPEWFSNEVINNELVAFLKEHKLGFVITDTSGRRDCAHMQLTVPKAFIRYVGNSLHPTDFIRVDEWIDRLKYWIDKGIEEVYFFMHMHDEAFSPELTVYMVDKLNDTCGLNLKKPIFIRKNPSLF